MGHSQCWSQSLQLLAMLVAVAAVAGGNSSKSCEKPAYKAAPFMNKPVPADSLDTLLGPLWWVMGGNPFGTYDTSTLRPQLMAYLKEYSIEPIAGVGALFCLVLLSMLAFLLWRFMRCLCVVCCQQEAYADASKVLFSRRLRTWKGAMVIAGLTGCAIGAWGMYSLNRNFPAYTNTEIDVVQTYPARLIALVDNLADQADGLKVPLGNFTGIIVNQVNISGIRSDVEKSAYFLGNAPTPAELKSILADLNAALNTSLIAALSALQAEIDGSPSSSLQQLRDHITVLTNFSTASMASTIASYDAAIQAVVNKTPPPSDANNDPDFQNLITAQAAVYAGLNTWLAAIADTRAAAVAVDAMRSPSTNPFTIIQARLDAVNASAQAIKGSNIANLTITIDRFNQLWYYNGTAGAFQGLIDRAHNINRMVMTLPADTMEKVNTVNASLAQINELYTGDNNLLQLPANITSMADNLTHMPNDTDVLRSKLQDAESLLNNAGPDIADMIQRLDNLTSLLNNEFRAAIDQVNASITQCQSDNDWTALTTSLAGPSVAVHAVSVKMADFSSMGPFVDTATSIRGKMDGCSQNLVDQAASINDIKATVEDFSFTSFTSSLDAADAVYAGFGSDPAQLLDPVRSMLDQIQKIADEQLDTAASMVDTVSGSIRKISGQIRNAAIDRVDSMQEKYLPLNVTDKKALNAVNAASWAYYGLLGAYALVLFLLLLLFLVTLCNCPAGICMTGFLLNLFLIFFALLPILYTVILLLLRDTCANVENVAVKAIQLKTGSNSTVSRVSSYYLGNGTLSDGTSSLTGLLKGINPDYDVDAVKAKVNKTIDDVLAGIADQNITLAEPVNDIMTNAKDRIQFIMGSVDNLITGLDYNNVSAVYQQFKGWICCDLTDQLFAQWAACLVLLALAWVALQCALAVLKNLDGLSDHCCGCSCYNARDYQAAPQPRTKRLSSLGVTGNSSSGETVAVINIGGLGGGVAKPGSKYELPDSTPLPAPLLVMTSPPSAPVLPSPRMYPTIAGPNPYGGAPMAPADLQTQRTALFSVGAAPQPLQAAMYPTVAPPQGIPGGGLGAGYVPQQQQQQQQQGYWGGGQGYGRNSPVTRM